MYVSCLYHANIYFLLTYHIALVMEKEDHYPATHSNNNNGNDYDMANHTNYYNTNISNSNSHHHQHQHQQMSLGGASSDRLSFADVMQFADFGPKLALNHISQDETTTAGAATAIEIINPIYFLKVPVLNDDKLENHNEDLIMVPPPRPNPVPSNVYDEDDEQDTFGDSRKEIEEEISRGNNSVTIATGLKNKRKRPRSVKTSEEVESQRMTHIAVERNRRKQMNEHLRVLRSLMPSSYVQRGDQASIIGGAIEFVRELEQLLQCLESQKRRRIYGDNNQLPDSNNNNSVPNIIFGEDPSMMMNNDVMKFDDMGHAREESAENKSCLADVEVKLLGFDAIIKILCRRRPGQLIKTIAALEDLQLNILHTNITTIEQTVLYSFNVKVASELRLNAEDIASSVQQIFTFIHASNI